MERLSVKIESFLRTGEGNFESTALELFAYQYEKNKLYHAYCRRQGATPGTVQRWPDIPAVPVRAFKSAELATFPVARSSAVFESSQTTSGGPSRHYLKDLLFYDSALKTSFSRWVLPDGAHLPFLILAPAPNEAPRSSLTWMFDVVKRKWGAEGSRYFVQRGRLDEPRLAGDLTKFQAAGSPVALLGTTIAFLSFLEYLRKTGKVFRLATGSRLMDTGGMKTQKREISRTEFLRQVLVMLGMTESHCINEYGMCEMSSQFYGKGLSTRLEGPPWVRTLVIDPLMGLEAPFGQEGLLRHYDLANVDSVMAIQTEDLGRAEEQGFTLLGRAPNAEVKGCSISAEAFLA